jgi:hypothetical protein
MQARGSRSRGHVLLVVAASALACVVAWVAFDHWVLAHPRAPRPGIHNTRWRTTRDLPPDPADGLAVQRTTVRTARVYLGPAIGKEDWAMYKGAGYCDAFYTYLRPQWKDRVDEGLKELEAVLDDVADASEKSIAEAKAAIRGTQDEFTRRNDRPRDEEEKAAMQEFLERARAANDMCVCDSYGGMTHEYRIRRSLHPRVYELKQQDADLNAIRQQRLGELIGALVDEHGLPVFDLAAMDRAWAETLAGSRRP